MFRLHVNIVVFAFQKILLLWFLQVVQLKELFQVRHSVFIVGSAGTGKTQIWKTLFKAYQNAKMKPYCNVIEPKSVTNDELFGVINPSTREWKDGIAVFIYFFFSLLFFFNHLVNAV